MRISSTAILALLALLPAFFPPAHAQQIVTGQAAFADWNQQQPGEFDRIGNVLSAIGKSEDSNYWNGPPPKPV